MACFFRITLLICYENKVSNLNGTNNSRAAQNEDKQVYENILCVFTQRRLLIFKVLDEKAFEINDFTENCLQKLFIIEIKQIEVIEISQCQNYIIVENSVSNTKNFRISKFVTFDIYKTQLFMNSISSNKDSIL